MQEVSPMKDSVLNTKATATPSAPTVTSPVTNLGPVGTANRSGYYRNVPEPLAYDTIKTADGRRIRVESHVIGRDC